MTKEEKDDIIKELLKSAELNLKRLGYEKDNIAELLLGYAEQLEEKDEVVLKSLLALNC